MEVRSTLGNPDDPPDPVDDEPRDAAPNGSYDEGDPSGGALHSVDPGQGSLHAEWDPFSPIDRNFDLYVNELDK